jgi:hypothetical protein
LLQLLLEQLLKMLPRSEGVRTVTHAASAGDAMTVIPTIVVAAASSALIVLRIFKFAPNVMSYAC